MGVKKVYSEPEFEIDRSVFESEKPISDGGWGGGEWGTWGTDFYDTETVTGEMTDAESTDYRSSFDEGDIGGGEETFFEEWTLG